MANLAIAGGIADKEGSSPALSGSNCNQKGCGKLRQDVLRPATLCRNSYWPVGSEEFEFSALRGSNAWVHLVV
jgi:hypothetical protein